MVKILNNFGKLLYIFTSFFPIYIFWTYFLFTQVTSWSIKNILQIEYIGFIILVLFSISSFWIFYYELLKKPKNPTEQFNIKEVKKNSSYIKINVSFFSPFIFFIIKFINNNQIVNTTIIIILTFIFIIICFMLILKAENGILYNIFYLRYNILNVKTEDGKEIIIISKKENLTGYVEVFQLDKKVFKEWN